MIVNCYNQKIFDTTLAYSDFTSYSIKEFIYDNPVTLAILVTDDLCDFVNWLDYNE